LLASSAAAAHLRHICLGEEQHTSFVTGMFLVKLTISVIGTLIVHLLWGK
jgi:hypothetical protein